MPLQKRILVGSALASLTAAVLAAAASKILWGYPFTRPGLPAVVEDAIRVTGAISVSNWQPNPNGTLQRRGEWFEAVSNSKKWPYETPDGRGMIWWQSKDLIQTEVSELPLDVAARAVKHVDFLFPSGEAPYDSSAHDRAGIVAEFDTAEEVGLLLVAVRGGQFRNDHFAYREAVLKPVGDGFEIVTDTGFEFAVAGIEGVEFPILFSMFLSLFFVAAVCIGIAVTIFKKKRLHNFIIGGGWGTLI